MPRARMIKPKFFLNEDLAELGSMAQVLFIGLWTVADCEGRLEDRPKRLKASLMPYYDCDVDGVLQGLAECGFILRYEVGGVRFIQIYHWREHQYPHKNEDASIIPQPGAVGLEVVPTPEKIQSVPDFIESTPENIGSTSQVFGLDTSNLDPLESVSPPISPPTGGEPSDNFTEFADYVWTTWPDRNGKKLYKGRALAVLRRLAARDWDAVALGVENFAASSQAKKGLAPDLFRWLRDDGWRDWQEPERVLNGKGSTPSLDPKKYTEGKYAGIFNPKAKAKGEGDAAPY